MKIAITGAQGYIGSMLVEAFKSKYQILKLYRGSHENAYELREPFSFGFDIPRYILHCAHDFDSTLPDANLIGVKNLFKSVSPDYTTVVYFSSLSAINPKSHYGSQKQEVENYVLSQTNGVVLRLGVVTSEPLGGFLGNIIEIIDKYSCIPLPIPSTIEIHETTSSSLIEVIQRIILNQQPAHGLIEVFNPIKNRLRELILRYRKVRFIPTHVYTLYLFVLIYSKIFTTSKVRADSVRSMF